MDEANNDFRLISVPAKDWPAGSRRPVYEEHEPYPRFVGAQMSPSYAPLAGQNLSEPIGHVDQVRHTYGRYETSYASMNEAGLSITESTCGAKTVALPVSQGGAALFWIGELSQLALERCATARCAVETMGKYGTEYGFYGEAEMEGSGESLLVADTSEAWVFHMLSSPCGKSAVWVARRVPDGHATVVANMFTIRAVTNDTNDYLHSSNMHSVAKEQGWWDGVSAFDFTAAYSIGEYGHEFYSGRRMWRALSLLAPSAHLDPEIGVTAETATYPWSVKPDAPVTLAQLRALNRDHYEGTAYDMTKGMAAGPFGSPNRLDGGTRFFPQPKGAWERAIAMWRTSYSLVLAPRVNSLVTTGPAVAPTGALWYAPHNPHASLYVPFLQAAAGQPDAVAKDYSTGSQEAFVYGKTTAAWWSTNLIMNWIDRMYSFMAPVVKEAQLRLETESEEFVAAQGDSLNTLFAGGATADEVRARAATAGNAHASSRADAWWALAGNLVQQFNDGYINAPGATGTIVGYPSWWLQRVGYTHFPTPPPAEKCT